MLRVRMIRVHHDRVERLRAWFRELSSRRAEVLTTFNQEGTRAESVHLLPGSEGPVLVYVMEIDDPEKAHRDSGRSLGAPSGDQGCLQER